MAEEGTFETENPEHDDEEAFIFYDFCPHCCRKMPFEQLLKHKAVCSARNAYHGMIKKFSASNSNSTFQSINDIELPAPPVFNSQFKNKAVDQKEFSSINKPKHSKLSDIIRPKVGKCCYCKTTLNANILSFHEKECVHQPIKCPACSATVLLKDVDEHRCGYVDKSTDLHYGVLTKEKGGQGNGREKYRDPDVSVPSWKLLKEFAESTLNPSSSSEIGILGKSSKSSAQKPEFFENLPYNQQIRTGFELHTAKPFCFCHYCFQKLSPDQVSHHKTVCSIRIHHKMATFSMQNEFAQNNEHKSVDEDVGRNWMKRLREKMGIPEKGGKKAQKAATSCTLSSAQSDMNCPQSSDTPLNTSENEVKKMKHSLCYYCGENIPINEVLQHKGVCPIRKLYSKDDVWAGFSPFLYTDDGSSYESASHNAMNSWSNKKTDLLGTLGKGNEKAAAAASSLSSCPLKEWQSKAWPPCYSTEIEKPESQNVPPSSYYADFIAGAKHSSLDPYQNYASVLNKAHMEDIPSAHEDNNYEDFFPLMDEDDPVILWENGDKSKEDQLAAQQAMMDNLDPMIPCEFCDKQFPASVIVLHMTGCDPAVSLPEPNSLTTSQPSSVPGSSAYKKAGQYLKTHKHLYQRSGTKSDQNLVNDPGVAVPKQNISQVLKEAEYHAKQLQASFQYCSSMGSGLLMPFAPLANVFNIPWESLGISCNTNSDKHLSSTNHPLPKPDSPKREEQKKNISKNLQQIQASLIASSRSNIFNPLEQASKNRSEKHVTASKEKVDNDHPKTMEISQTEEKSEESSDPNVCYICHEEVFPGTGKAMVTDCGHIYCFICISAWRKKSPKCPVCSHFWHFSKDF